MRFIKKAFFLCIMGIFLSACNKSADIKSTETNTPKINREVINEALCKCGQIIVFFNEDLTEEERQDIGKTITETVSHVISVKYTSPEEAWDTYVSEYFQEDPSLADGFKDENPLASSANYIVHIDSLFLSEDVCDSISCIKGVRKVDDNYPASINYIAKEIGFSNPQQNYLTKHLFQLLAIIHNLKR